MSEPLVRLQLIVPESFKRRLKVAAAKNGTTMTEALVTGWFEWYGARPTAGVARDVAAAEPDEPLPHERNAEIRHGALRASGDSLLRTFPIARSHEVDSSGICVSWCFACRQSDEAARKADYEKAVRLANEPR